MVFPPRKTRQIKKKDILALQDTKKVPHTHTRTHTQGKQNSPVKTKNMEYEGQNTRGILRSTSNEYISEGWC